MNPTYQEDSHQEAKWWGGDGSQFKAWKAKGKRGENQVQKQMKLDDIKAIRKELKERNS